MTDQTQRVTDVDNLALDLRDSRALTQSQAATIAEQAREIERLKEMHISEYKTIDRIWKAMGIATYEEAQGKTIFELVAELKTRAEAAESTLATYRADAVEEMMKATARIEKLEAALRAWRECALYDATIEGPVFKGWNRSALDRCRLAALSEDKSHD
jgi:hypothetical protein